VIGTPASRSVRLAVATAAGIVVALAGCGGEEEPSGADSVVEEIVSGPDFPNPVCVYASTNAPGPGDRKDTAFGLLYEPLLAEHDAEGEVPEIVEQLAERCDEALAAE
jgi:hypothetical protein